MKLSVITSAANRTRILCLENFSARANTVLGLCLWFQQMFWKSTVTLFCVLIQQALMSFSRILLRLYFSYVSEGSEATKGWVVLWRDNMLRNQRFTQKRPPCESFHLPSQLTPQCFSQRWSATPCKHNGTETKFFIYKGQLVIYVYSHWLMSNRCQMN